MRENKHRVFWPGWITRGRICGQGYGSLWELWQENGQKTATVKYITVPRSALETEALLAQGKSREYIRAYYEYLCRGADEEYAVSEELRACRHVALYRDIRKERAADGLGWDILLMMDNLLPVDRCMTAPTEEQAVKLARQICIALEDSSCRGLLHGRITPRCIFRDANGSFQLGGFAGEYCDELGDFRAPEVAENKFADTRSDVYSLGMVLYWLLNDRRFPGKDRFALRIGSEQLKAIILKAIAPRAEDRYQTPAELRGALNAIAAQKKEVPVVVPRKRSGMPLLAAAALVMVIMALVLLRPSDRRQEEANPSQTLCPHDVWIEADCENPKICRLCNEVIGNALGHKWLDATCVYPKTCEVCGAEAGRAAGHQWTDATCISPRICKVCGEETGSAAGHQWLDATCISPRTCRVCGEETGSTADHIWMEATYTSAKKCSICSITEGQPKENPLVEFIRERLPIVTYVLGPEQRIYGYADSALAQKVDAYYIESDQAEIVITDISKDGTALKIRFRTSTVEDTYDTLWFSFDDIFALDGIEISYHTTTDWLPTYRLQQGNDELTRYGGLEAGWNFYVLGDQESGRSVIYYTIVKRTVYGLSVKGKIALVNTTP